MDFLGVVKKLLGRKTDGSSGYPVLVNQELIDEPEREIVPYELVLGIARWRDSEEEPWKEKTKTTLQEYRLAHFYVVGGTKTGKTKFLESIAEQDIVNGEGFGVIDAHGDLTEDLKGLLYLSKRDEPEFLTNNVILIDPTDEEQTVSFNPLELLEGMKPHLLAEQLVMAFKKIWADAWGDRMNNILTHTLIALIEHGQTLAEVQPLLTDPAVRRKFTSDLKNEATREFFQKFNSWTKNVQIGWTESTLNKISTFLTNTEIRQMFLSPKSTFDLRNIIDNRKILLLKLEKGQLGSSGGLLGSLLLSKITAAAFSRTDIPEEERTLFYLYIDEFQNFAADNFSEILSEAAKYRLSLMLAHQFLGQIPNSLRAAIFSNCGLQTYFRISREDASLLARESLTSVYQEPPGWEWYVQRLQEMQNRICAIKNTIVGGVVVVETMQMEKPYEKAGVELREFAEIVRQANIGGAYLRRREDVEKEYQERRRKLLADEDEPEAGEDSFKEKVF